MARFKPNVLLSELHGKHCMHSDTYYARRYDTNYTGTICNENPRNNDPTPNQVVVRQRFRQAVTATKALTTAELEAYQTAFSNQRKYKSFNGYITAMEYAKLTAAASSNSND